MVDAEELASKSTQSMNTEHIELYKRIQAFSLDIGLWTKKEFASNSRELNSSIKKG